jgi:hypothetical protein
MRTKDINKNRGSSPLYMQKSKQCNEELSQLITKIRELCAGAFRHPGAGPRGES